MLKRASATDARRTGWLLLSRRGSIMASKTFQWPEIQKFPRFSFFFSFESQNPSPSHESWHSSSHTSWSTTQSRWRWWIVLITGITPAGTLGSGTLYRWFKLLSQQRCTLVFGVSGKGFRCWGYQNVVLPAQYSFLLHLCITKGIWEGPSGTGWVRGRWIWRTVIVWFWRFRCFFLQLCLMIPHFAGTNSSPALVQW